MLFVLFTKVQYRSRTGSCWCYLFCFVYQGAIQIKNWKPLMLFVLFTKVRYRSRTGSHWCCLFCLPRCNTDKELEATDAICFVYQGAIQIKNWKPLMLFVLFTKVPYRSRTGSHWCYLFCLPRCDTDEELEVADAICFVYQGAIQIKNWKPLMLFVLFTKVRYRSRTGSHWCYLFCLPRCDTDQELEATDAICFVYQGAIQIKNWKPLTLDAITNNPQASIDDILSELTNVATLRIRIAR